MSTNDGKSPPTIPFLALACWVQKKKNHNFLPAETELDRAASGGPCIRRNNHTYTVILRDMVCSDVSEPQSAKINFVI